MLGRAGDLEEPKDLGTNIAKNDVGTARPCPAAGAKQAPQAGRVDEENIAEINDDRPVALALEDRGLENRATGDVDIAVHDDHAFWAVVDGERIRVSHLSQVSSYWLNMQCERGAFKDTLRVAAELRVSWSNMVPEYFPLGCLDVRPMRY